MTTVNTGLIVGRIAEEIKVKPRQVEATVALLDEGATVPFIARYRKEATGGLDDTQLRKLEERLTYLRELMERRAAILKSIDGQEKLTSVLESKIQQAWTKTELEDLYLPYKPKRRTKGQIAREAGLEPLAESLLADPLLAPEVEAQKYLNSEEKITTIKDALDGAKYILMEKFSEDAGLLGSLRDYMKSYGFIKSVVATGKETEGKKFQDYFEHKEAIAKVPSHRALAMFRGRREGFLNLTLDLEQNPELGQKHPCEGMVAKHWNIQRNARAADDWLEEVVRWTWKVKLYTQIETDLFGDLRTVAEQAAIEVFAANLKDLLLAAPAGQKAAIGLDPGLRTGVKVAVVDSTGKVLDHGAIFPTPPQNKVREAEVVILGLCQKYNTELIAIGNGTASRETEKFIANTIKKYPEIKARSVMVNEAGASVYSASEFAAKEFPDLDVTIRGAISIARRLQDPLAELVKIDPKSIGVGQYQHDVSQVQLAKSLEVVVEDCVNQVGVELNSASAPLLARVSGLNQSIANNIVEFRDKEGAFKSREELKKVPRLGEKAFEQAAGFLRIANGVNPLDASGVHPEAYALVSSIAEKNNKQLTEIIADSSFLRAVNAAEFANEQFGLPTITDILSELEKPGRDPRPEFKTASFAEGVEKISDLYPGMVLEGSITNVTHFGAFVDLGVHQDGLVHISALSDTFIKDPRELVKAGDIVKVKVMEVEQDRKRIALSMRLSDEPGKKEERKSGSIKKFNNKNQLQQRGAKQTGTMAALFAEAQKKNQSSKRK